MGTHTRGKRNAEDVKTETADQRYDMMEWYDDNCRIAYVRAGDGLNTLCYTADVREIRTESGQRRLRRVESCQRAQGLR